MLYMDTKFPVHKKFLEAFAESCMKQGFTAKQASELLVIQLQKEAEYKAAKAAKKTK